MIVERNQKVTGFKKEKYYVTHLKYMDMDAVSEHFQTKEEAEQVAADCANRMCEVIKDDVSSKTVKAPKLYDLTTLQRESNQLFGYTAQQTLDSIQNLYEKKLVTYPRTDSQFLTEDMGESTEKLITLILDVMPFAEGYSYEPKVSQVLNSKKVSDHHAIIPTAEIAKADLQGLTQRERNLLYLIASKVLTATGESYQYDSHKCEITCNNHIFSISAVKVTQTGFRELEKKFKAFAKCSKDEKEEPELEIYLGAHFGFCDTYVAEQYTQPPKQFNDASLLYAMERAGNEELTEETEKKGLGTPATRASIIEKLIQSGFVKREKKNLIPTDNGNALISILPEDIKSPKMTAEWEMILNHIAQGSEQPERFLDDISGMIRELTGRYHAVSEENAAKFSGGRDRESLGKCPRCGSDVVEGKSNFYCTNRECRFALWKNDRFFASQGKQMDKKTAKQLLSKGKVHYKDLVSKKTGNTYEATILMADTGEGYVNFNMEFPQR
jgi:DNA topoisomerase-3